MKRTNPEVKNIQYGDPKTGLVTIEEIKRCKGREFPSALQSIRVEVIETWPRRHGPLRNYEKVICAMAVGVPVVIGIDGKIQTAPCLVRRHKGKVVVTWRP